jgi:hypothetical protein
VSRTLGRALAALAVIWAVLVVAAPWLAAVPAVGGAYLSAFAYGFGALICHQRPERSFHVAGAQLPVCARCTGLYVSAAIGIVFAWARSLSSSALPFAKWRACLVWAALPTVVTLVLEWWRPAATSGVLRAAAAVPLGAAAGALVADAFGFRSKLHGCERTGKGV